MGLHAVREDNGPTDFRSPAFERLCQKSDYLGKSVLWFEPIPRIDEGEPSAFESRVYEVFSDRVRQRMVDSEKAFEAIAQRVQRTVDADSTSSDRGEGDKLHTATAGISKITNGRAVSRGKSRLVSRGSDGVRGEIPTLGATCAYLRRLRMLGGSGGMSYSSGRGCQESVAPQNFSPALERELCVALILCTHTPSECNGAGGPSCRDSTQRDESTTLPELNSEYFRSAPFASITRFNRQSGRAVPGNQLFIWRETYDELQRIGSADKAFGNEQDRPPHRRANNHAKSYDRDEATEARGWLELLRRTALQSRGGTLVQQLLAIFSSASIDGHIHMPTMSRIRSIISKLCVSRTDEFPYIEEEDRTGKGIRCRFSPRARTMPCRLSLMLYVYIHQHIFSMCGTYLTKRDLEVALLLQEQCWMDGPSFEDATLKMKAPIDVISDYLACRSKFQRLQISPEAGIIKTHEPFTPTRLQDHAPLHEMLETWPLYRHFCDRNASSIDELNMYNAMALCAVSSPIYATHSLSLVVIKSQFASPTMTVDEPRVVVEAGGVPLVYDASQTRWAVWAKALDILLDGVEGEVAELDLESEFMRALTSNSSGTLPLKLTDDLAKRYPSKVARALIHSKIGLVMLAPEILMNYDEWGEVNKTKPGITLRKQLMRRARGVVMVSVTAQMMSLHVQNALKVVGRNHDEIGVGKVTGGSTDAAFQLWSTGAKDQITSSADVKGFDGGLNLTIRAYLRAIVAAKFELNNNTFFHAKPKDVMALVEGKPTLVRVNAVQDVLIKGSPYAGAPEGVDREFGESVVLSAATLMSGEFGTTGFGTLTTAATIKACQLMRPEYNITGHSAGDDIIISFDAGPKEKIADRADDVRKVLAEVMASIGMTLDPFMSEVSGIFLQMPVIAGTASSSLYRLSISTIENPSLGTIYKKWSEVSGIANEMYGRAQYPEGILRFISPLFCTMANVSVGREKPADPNARLCPISRKWIIPLPDVMMHLPRFGSFPFPRTLTSNGWVSGDSPTTLRGDGGWFNVVKRVQIPGTLFSEPSEPFKYGVESIATELYSKGGATKRAISRCLSTDVILEMDLDRAIVYSQFSEGKFMTDLRAESIEVQALVEKGKKTFDSMNFDKVMAAHKAKQKLSDLGVNVSPSLDYTAQAELKMMDVVGKIVYSGAEWKKLDNYIRGCWDQIKSNRSSKTFGIPLEMQLFFVDVSESPFDVDPNPVTTVIPKISITPPCIGSGHYRNQYMRSGITTVGMTHTMGRLGAAIGSGYFNDKTKEVNELIGQLRKLNSDQFAEGVALAARVMSLNPTAAGDFYELATSGNRGFDAALNIQSTPRVHPWMNDNIQSVTGYTADFDNTTSPKINGLRRVVACAVERSVGSYFGMKRIRIVFPSYHTGLTAMLTSEKRRGGK